MKQTEAYVVGELEFIGRKNGKIAVRIKNCGPKVKVYGIREIESPFEGNIYGEFGKDDIKLSHLLVSFAQGDKVKLIRHFGDDDDEYDVYTLENLTLSSEEIGGLDELEPKSCEIPFCIEVNGTLLHIGWGRTKISLRLKCSQRKLVFFDENTNMSEKKEAFEKIIYGEIPMDMLRLDIGIDTLAAYKDGDKVSLSRLTDDGSFDLDNLTLAVSHAKPKYKSQWEL